MLLTMDKIDFFVKKTHILRSVSLEVAPGEIVGLLGRNGAGKSSIMKSIMGLYQPKSGTIFFQDQDVTKDSTRSRVLSGLAYAPEDSRVFPELSVAENINLGLWVSQDSPNGATFEPQQGFDIFPKLRELWERKGGTLSGGEKKMVAVTRALALNPRLLLLDESFEGLAPLVVRHFIDAMRRIRGMGISIILAASNLGNASKVVDRAYVVERGEILFQGTPEEIVADEKLALIVGR
ncbi:MAG: ATP-binding cassette domain-containing protein [Desulfarculaceae bacterium]|nr:ATP-binding cassette domain-containing protein [Desulfarculaceae bacterium]MCF8102111.1 ATP-binding cassette domain-containing protein [Desulfarculaceae bacterium]MCF8118344.1 ATP-binding cassette domain-containing protein [Desulfarculaceae bacterium]